ncbi:MAG: 30S ribosomal protein S17 [Planctomycetia bacterium]
MTNENEPVGTAPAEDDADRNTRKVTIGRVKSASMQKTCVVDVPRLVRHPKYGKYLHRRTVCYVHDETNTAKVGDQVEIMETRPLSKLKRWRLVRVVAGAAKAGAAAEVPAEPAN